jgi:hypothetical protein
MVADVKILTVADRGQWEEVEIAGAAPSQCWRFAAALMASGYDPRLAIVDAGGSRLLLPFIQRTWREHTDIATLPGLSGASIVPPSGAPLARWHEFAAASGWVCGYIQLSPMTYPNVPAETITSHRTHVFRINPSTWDRQKTPSTIIRRKLAAARRSCASISPDRSAVVARLWTLYQETLSRFGHRPNFTSETLSHWSRDPQNVVVGLMVDGSVEGAQLVHVHEHQAEVQIVATTDRGRRFSALLYAETLERLAERNVTCCNLGGGGNPGDGLFMFKTWLGATPVPLRAIRQIYDVPTYETLCRTAGKEQADSYFPVYRTVSNG